MNKLPPQLLSSRVFPTVEIIDLPGDVSTSERHYGKRQLSASF